MPASAQKFAAKPSLADEVRAEVMAIKRAFRRISKSPKSTIAFLSKAGILTKGGKLAKEYR